MVLGLRSKSRKCVSIQVEYLVCVERIKPWPSGRSLKSPQFLLIQWENGDQSSGSFRCSVGEGQIEIGESFKLPVILYQEASKKRSTHKSFQKNFLEFQLYESQSHKAVKGQLLGSTSINLAEYGASKDTVKISASVSCKKGLKHMEQPPLLYVSIEPLSHDGSSSSRSVGLLKEESLEKGGSGSISPLVNDGDDEVEISSFTDDDNVSTHSSQVVSSAASDAAGASLSQKNEEEAGPLEKGTAAANGEDLPLTGNESYERKEVHNHKSETSLKGLQSDLSNNYGRNLEQKTAAHESITDENDRGKSTLDLPEMYARSITQNYNKSWVQSKASPREAATSDELTAGHSSEKEENGLRENGLSEQTFKAVKHLSEDELLIPVSRSTVDKQVTFRKGQGALGDQSNIGKSSALKRAKSTFVPSAISDGAELLMNSHTLRRDGSRAAFSSATSSKASNNEAKLESKVAMLEEELREAAALEISLYSVIAEHGSSSNKIHSPARRLSRFYIHACQTNLPAKRVSAARAIVSGLALVSKACGNDVPRLTFWLSNTIVLRAIATFAAKKSKFAAETCKGSHGNGGLSTKPSGKSEHSNDWENAQIFALALERVEAWIFSRIVESVWWQTMTPYMQSSVAKRSSSRKSHGKKHMLGNPEQGPNSIELWKKAFKDGCERLCPVRAEGHECACLCVLTRLVMEQLVGRLDVAMFNAILRESPDEMPTDPVSDPITDSKVLPIPAGKSGFGAGAQLKNAISSWSQWLSDIFSMDQVDSHVEPNEYSDNSKKDSDSSFRAFHLLNALSDLMMLPFEMLADRTTRKEVCPAFGVPLIKRVLYNFVPDEFFPEPVPQQVLEAIETEDHSDADDSSITNIPYIAPTTLYTPPPASSLSSIIGDIGSGDGLLQSKSSLLRKSYTSDDELDELDSPIASIALDKSRVSPSSSSSDWLLKGKGARKVVRYQLLREVWRDGE